MTVSACCVGPRRVVTDQEPWTAVERHDALVRIEPSEAPDTHGYEVLPLSSGYRMDRI